MKQIPSSSYVNDPHYSVSVQELLFVAVVMTMAQRVYSVALRSDTDKICFLWEFTFIVYFIKTTGIKNVS